MRVVLAQLAPRPGDVEGNVARIAEIVGDHPESLVVLPELFTTGYRIGDRLHELAVRPGGAELARLGTAARRSRSVIAFGAAVRHARRGEVENAAVLVRPDGSVEIRAKRFLPSYGPFEEGTVFTPAPLSEPVDVPGARLGLQICYDAFFPEVSRELAVAGSDLLVVLSAAPITSRRLFDRVLPARAIENALPLVYVNRAGVEDGLVFGGGSVALDARGEPVRGEGDAAEGDRSREAVWVVELDLADAGRWRPFRPVLRDAAATFRGTPSDPTRPRRATAE